jgi:hypothetical protein
MKYAIVGLIFLYITGFLGYIIFRFAPELEDEDVPTLEDYLIGIFWFFMIWVLIWAAVVEDIAARRRDNKEFMRSQQRKKKGDP